MNKTMKAAVEQAHRQFGEPQKKKNSYCLCGAFFFDPGEEGTPFCPVHQPKQYAQQQRKSNVR